MSIGSEKGVQKSMYLFSSVAATASYSYWPRPSPMGCRSILLKCSGVIPIISFCFMCLRLCYLLFQMLQAIQPIHPKNVPTAPYPNTYPIINNINSILI